MDSFKKEYIIGLGATYPIGIGEVSGTKNPMIDFSYKLFPTKKRFIFGIEEGLWYSPSSGTVDSLSLLLGGAVIKNEKLILAVLADGNMTFGAGSKALTVFGAGAGLDVYAFVPFNKTKTFGMFASTEVLYCWQMLVTNDFDIDMFKGIMLKPSIGFAFHRK